MLCDELKWKWVYGPYLDPPEGQKESAIKAGYIKVVSKQSADEAIAELKEFAEDACIERDDNQTAIDELQAENECLKQKLEDAKATAYAESVDAGMRERRLRRALWLARALRARDIQRWWIAATCSKTTERACSVWNNVERKCRAKAEQYK